MKVMIGWLTAITVLASPCAWDTSQRELLERLKPGAAAAVIPQHAKISQALATSDNHHQEST